MELKIVFTLLLSAVCLAVEAKGSLTNVLFRQPCKTKMNEDGVCVYQYQCRNGVVGEYGEGIIDIRQQDDDCSDYFMKCCKEPANNNETESGGQAATTHATDSAKVESTTVHPSVEGKIEQNFTSPSTEGASDNSWDVAESGVNSTHPIAQPGSWLNTSTKPPQVQLTAYDLLGCGHRNPNGAGFTIANNEHSESEFGEYPWSAAVFQREHNGSLRYLCGAALIDQAAVLTTANCLYGYRARMSELVVRLGEWDLSTNQEPIPHVDSAVQTIHLHPQYSITVKTYDIAILILQETIEMGRNINAVCLPPANSEPSQRDMMGVGWGDVPAFVTPKKLPQTILKKTHLALIPHNECQSQLRRLINSRFTLHPGFLCAVASPTEMLPCQGDSGSPYVSAIKGSDERYYLTGLSSWGYDCNKQNTPTVLTNVAYHREWIDEVFKNENFSTWSYTYTSETDSSGSETPEDPSHS